MVGVEEGLFPSIRASESSDDDDIEEERRLCYVGMTRAKRKLFMTHAVCRRVYGNIVYHEPACFFQEIPEEYVDFKDLSRFRMGASNQRSDTYDDDYAPTSSASLYGRSTVYSNAISSPGYAKGSAHDTLYSGMNQLPSSGPSVGSKVRHGEYGVGVIRGIEGADQNAKVTIEFSGRILKKFVLKFANLEILSG